MIQEVEGLEVEGLGAESFTRLMVDQLRNAGILQGDLTETDYEYLCFASHVLDELGANMDRLLGGDYPKPGYALHSLEIYGLFQCLFAYEDGVLLLDALKGMDIDTIPLVRLYINRQIVGLAIFGKPVMDYCSDYLDWLQAERGLNFSFF